MKLKSGSMIEEMAGTAANSQLVYYMVKGKLVARARVKGSNPQTPEQTRMRKIHADAVKQWSTLSADVRKAWNQWGAKWHLTWSATCDTGANLGRNIYVSAARQKMILALPPCLDAPIPLPAPELISAEEIPTGDPTKFSYRIRTAPITVESDVELPELAIVARITPATVGQARAPYTNHLRLISGASPASSCALPDGSDAVVTFESSRFTIEPGKRYGFELTPVRLVDGVPGLSLWFNAERK